MSDVAGRLRLASNWMLSEGGCDGQRRMSTDLNAPPGSIRVGGDRRLWGILKWSIETLTGTSDKDRRDFHDGRQIKVEAERWRNCGRTGI
jgi:hypothetical protein